MSNTVFALVMNNLIIIVAIGLWGIARGGFYLNPKGALKAAMRERGFRGGITVSILDDEDEINVRAYWRPTTSNPSTNGKAQTWKKALDLAVAERKVQRTMEDKFGARLS